MSETDSTSDKLIVYKVLLKVLKITKFKCKRIVRSSNSLFREFREEARTRHIKKRGMQKLQCNLQKSQYSQSRIKNCMDNIQYLYDDQHTCME